MISARMAIFPMISVLESTVPNWSSTTTGHCLGLGNLVHLGAALLQGHVTDQVPGALCTCGLTFAVAVAMLGMSFCQGAESVIVGYVIMRLLAAPAWAAQGKVV